MIRTPLANTPNATVIQTNRPDAGTGSAMDQSDGDPIPDAAPFTRA